MSHLRKQMRIPQETNQGSDTMSGSMGRSDKLVGGRRPRSRDAHDGGLSKAAFKGGNGHVVGRDRLISRARTFHMPGGPAIPIQTSLVRDNMLRERGDTEESSFVQERTEDSGDSSSSSGHSNRERHIDSTRARNPDGHGRVDRERSASSNHERRRSSPSGSSRDTARLA
jgi:hypothetical protein